MPAVKNVSNQFGDILNLLKFSEYRSQLSHKDIRQLCEQNIDDPFWHHRGVNVFEHAFAATARYYAKGDPSDEPFYKDVLTTFAVATVQSLDVYSNIFDAFDPEVIVAHHGIYVPQGPAVALAKVRDIKVVSYTPSYRKGTFIFAEGDTYHKVMPTRELEATALTNPERAKTIDYLQSRQNAEQDWIWYLPKSEEDQSIRDKFGIAKDKNIVAMFTNVFWDAQLHFDDAIFDNMMDWVHQTIDHFQQFEDTALVIRAHPGESSGFVPSRQPLDVLLADKLAHAGNVHLIPSSDEFNNYDLAQMANVSVVYGTKLACELPALGSIVIVAGEAWAKGKGFTVDALSKEHYFGLLEKYRASRGGLPTEMQDLALAYCHQFFFRDMQPIEVLVPTGDKFRHSKCNI